MGRKVGRSRFPNVSTVMWPDPERGLLIVQERLDGFAQILHQMKPIHDLHGLRSAAPDAVGVEGTAIPTDDRHRGMLGQPGRQTVRRALGQEVEHLMVLQIDEDGAIALPPPPRPLIDANDLRRRGGRRRGRLHQPQEGGGTASGSPRRAASRAPASPPRARP